MAESDEALRLCRCEREAGERERWALLQRVQQEADTAAKMARHLADKEHDIDLVNKICNVVQNVVDRSTISLLAIIKMM